jgi:hypothetical protein
MAALWQADTDAARPLGEKSLRIWRELNNPMETAFALEALGWVHFFSNHNESALRHMQESLEIVLGLGNERMINREKVSVAQVLVAMGKVDDVERMATDTLLQGRKLGESRDIHYSLHFLGDCSLLKRDPVEAEKRYGRSLQAALDYHNTAEAAVELQGIAMSLAGQRRIEKAFRLNGAAEAKMKAIGFDIGSALTFWANFKQMYLETARSEFGNEFTQRLEEEGRHMGFDAAVPYALDPYRD